MRWKGTVSHRWKITMAARFASENPAQVRSGQAGRSGQPPPGRSPGTAGAAGPSRPGCQPASSRRSQGRASTLESGQLIALTTHRLDQLEPELRAEPPYAHVDDVRAGIEFEPPHRGQ